MKAALYLLKLILKGIYSVFKILPVNTKKVVFISRQANYVSLDFKLLSQEITKLDNEYKTIFLCKKINMNAPDLIKYFFHVIRQMYHLATSRVCIVDSYCITVSILKHKKSLIVIQLWHALAAIKKFGYQSLGKKSGRDYKLAKLLNMHANYNYVISGSEEMSKFFSQAFKISKTKIKPIGTPKMDYLIKNKAQIIKNIKSKYPNLTKKKVILYVPTFRKNKQINIDKILNTVDFNKYNMIVKTHPGKSQKFITEYLYNCNDFSAFELLTIADYIITDYSSISVEAAILEKPIFFYLYDVDTYERDNGLNIDLFKEMKGCCYRNFKSLYKQMDSGKYNTSQLYNFKNKYITNQKGNSGYILANFIVNGVWIENN